MSYIPLTFLNPSLTTCNVTRVAKLTLVANPAWSFHRVRVDLNATTPVPRKNAVTMRVVWMMNHAILRGSK
jgi:hypothetical protein